MQQASIEQLVPLEWQEEWQRFNKWASESRSTVPFVYLALLWHGGHLTIDEGRRIEREQQLAKFLQRK